VQSKVIVEASEVGSADCGWPKAGAAVLDLRGRLGYAAGRFTPFITEGNDKPRGQSPGVLFLLSANNRAGNTQR
jgi:hypothetical protein